MCSVCIYHSSQQRHSALWKRKSRDQRQKSVRNEERGEEEKTAESEEEEEDEEEEEEDDEDDDGLDEDDGVDIPDEKNDSGEDCEVIRSWAIYHFLKSGFVYFFTFTALTPLYLINLI